MTEFKARLRAPKRQYWMGCVVAGMEGRVSLASGRPYVVVRFENCPFSYILGEFYAQRMRLAMVERGLQGEVLSVGDVVNLDVRWRAGPGSTARSPVIYPSPEVDWTALLEARSLEASLVDVGRA